MPARLLLAAALRELARQPLQFALAVLGIALGVAVVLAVRLATASALDGFERAADALGGRATHALLAGPAGVPDDAWRWLRIEAGVRSAAPLVQGWVERTDAPGRWLQLIGVDPWAEAPLARGGARLGGWPAQLTTQPDAVLASSALARRLQLAVGDRLTIRAGGRTQSLRIAGRFEADDDAAAERLIADIATAQAVLGRAGRLDRIDLVLDDAAAAALAARLPPPLRLETAAARAGELGRLTAAFRFNLDALSLLALLVGAFLIRNTLEFAVVRRRPLLGLLRALGVTRRELLGLIALEAAVLGLLGSALGLLLGALLARGLTGLVGRTLAEVYHALDAVTLALTPGALAAAAALGLAATLAAAVRPALAAAGAPAGSAANRAAEQHESAHPPQRALGRAALLAAAGLGCLGLPGAGAGYLALLGLMLAYTGVLPVLLAWLARTAAARLPADGLPLARMAVRNLGRHLARTSAAVAALSVAFAAAFGMAMMIASFRDGVNDWLLRLLNADFYAAPLAPEGGEVPPFAPGVLEALQHDPAVAALASYRRLEIPVDGRPVQLIITGLPPAARAGYRLLQGDPARAWAAFDAGSVLIGEPLATRLRLGPGDELALATDHGPRRYPIAGVYTDYGSEHGRALIHPATAARDFAPGAPASAGVFLKPGVDPQAARAGLEARLAPLQAVELRPNHTIVERSLAIFDRTFTITAVLRVLALVVAAAGVLGTLLALALERGREFAVLRALGLLPGELLRLLAIECGLLGLAAGLLALPLGGLTGLILTDIVNRRAFGWSLPLTLPLDALVQTVLLAVIAALAAGLYPAWRLARTPPAAALREE